MQAKRKKKKTIVINSTQSRAVCLREGKIWLTTCEGGNVVRGYAKKYRVDLLCAINDLRMLGVEIKAEYGQAVRQTIAQQTEQRGNKKEQELTAREFDEINEYKDWDFAFIAGHTWGGEPYGIRREEMPIEIDESLF